VQTGELRDRISGLEETHAAHRHADALSARIESSEVEVEQLRQSFLLRRIERRQAETLIEVTRARDGAEAERRGQQGLDDRHGSLVFRANAVGVRTKKIAGVSAELPPDAPNGESHGRET
jgi:hypothetical protein